MKARLVLPAATALVALALGGCGGGGGGSSSDSGAASLAPLNAPLFIEATLRPEGQQKADLDSLANKIAGADSLGELIVTELEKKATSEHEPLDFEKEVEPWLGEKGGLSFESYDGDDFHGYGVAIETTDLGATERFVDKAVERADEKVTERSAEGVDFKIQEDGTAIGLIGNFLAIAESQAAFKAMVDASDGESLADRDAYSNAVAAAPSDSVANVFVDVGGLIRQSGGSIDPEAKLFLESTGIEPRNATATASLIPGSDRVELDLTTNLVEGGTPSDDVSEVLSSLPASSFAALASTEFGKQFGEAVDQIDANGIPGQVKPHEFKSGLEAAGIDLEKLSASVTGLGVFAEGDTKDSLKGAAVFTVKDAAEARRTVASVGFLLRASQTPGVTAVNGSASGFSVPVPDLGPKPLVVVAKGNRIAVGYGLPAALRGLKSEAGPVLADDSTYKEAAAALGDTPISGFADGPAALRLASALISPGEEDFRKAKPYLEKIDYLALGSGSSDGLATVKLIAGIGK
jgi:uncharacterized protein DUF3352